MDHPVSSTTYTVAGMSSAEDTRRIKEKLGFVEGIGAIATEIVPGEPSRLILKHKQDVVVDRAAIAAALREAGDYELT